MIAQSMNRRRVERYRATGGHVCTQFLLRHYVAWMSGKDVGIELAQCQTKPYKQRLELHIVLNV
jgi:hypothetical protein